jgi:hypothetical protein
MAFDAAATTALASCAITPIERTLTRSVTTGIVLRNIHASTLSTVLRDLTLLAPEAVSIHKCERLQRLAFRLGVVSKYQQTWGRTVTFGPLSLVN